MTGELYAADVGPDRNTFSREEVSRIQSGGNYGWVIKSGTEINTVAAGFSPNIGVPLIDPIAQYPTTQNGPGGLAVIGGFVYRGPAITALQGKYVFGDLNRGNGTGGRMLYTELGDSALTVFDINIVGAVPKPSVFLHGVAEDARGEIYFLLENGQVMRLVPVPEPCTCVLMLTSAVLAGMLLRFRQRSALWVSTAEALQ